MYVSYLGFQKNVLRMLMEIRDSIKIALPSGKALLIQPAATDTEFMELESRLADEKERAALVSLTVSNYSSLWSCWLLRLGIVCHFRHEDNSFT